MENDMAEDIEDPQPEGGDSRNWRQLEKQRDDAGRDAAKWKGLFESARSQSLAAAVQLAGFKPNEDGVFEGVTGLLVEKFEAGLGDEDLPDPTSFAELAKQYGVEATPPSNQPPAGEPTGDGQPVTNDLAAQLAALATGDQLVGLGTPPKPPADIDERLAAAEKAGDVQAVIHLQQQKAYAAA